MRCRGYIASRPIKGIDWPQQVQNLAIRDYAKRNGLTFLLSATEYRMANCYMILDAIMDDLDSCDGIIMFSLFALPHNSAQRHPLYENILSNGKSFYFALESLQLSEFSDVSRIEDIYSISQLTNGSDLLAPLKNL